MVMSKQQLAKKIFDLERQNKLPTGSYHSLVGSESNFNPTAKSPADAHGYAQIIPSTGKELGIDIHDPIQNLEGGARYLKTQLDKFGSLPLAYAAYNAGPGAVQKYGNKIPPYKETQGYVRKNMAKMKNWFDKGKLASQLKVRGVSDMPTEQSPEWFSQARNQAIDDTMVSDYADQMGKGGGGGGGGFSGGLDSYSMGQNQPETFDPSQLSGGGMGMDIKGLKELLGIGQKKNKFAQIMDAVGTGAYGLGEAFETMQGDPRAAALMRQQKEAIGAPERQKNQLLQQILLKQMFAKGPGQEQLYDRYLKEQSGLGQGAVGLLDFLKQTKAGGDDSGGPIDMLIQNEIMKELGGA
jgi:hypothetical protein